jgi:hypothetical protein
MPRSILDIAFVKEQRRFRFPLPPLGVRRHGQTGEGMPIPMLAYCPFEPYTDTIFISGQRMAQTPARRVTKGRTDRKRRGFRRNGQITPADLVALRPASLS